MEEVIKYGAGQRALYTVRGSVHGKGDMGYEVEQVRRVSMALSLRFSQSYKQVFGQVLKTGGGGDTVEQALSLA